MYWSCREAATRSIAHYVVLSGLTMAVRLAAYQRDYWCDCHGDVEAMAQEKTWDNIGSLLLQPNFPREYGFS